MNNQISSAISKFQIANIGLWITYNIFLFCYFGIMLPFYLIKVFTQEKYRVGLKERFGIMKRLPRAKRILIHTVSVGEFLSSLPLIKELCLKYPDCEIAVSTTTAAGHAVALKRMSNNDKVRILFYPLDFSFSVKRFLNNISPKAIILLETELWPNFLRISKGRKIPVLVLNGRISEHSYKNYSILKGFFKRMCNSISIFGVQTERDMNRLINLGIKKEKIRITGSLKIDSAVQFSFARENLEKLKTDWGWNKDMLVLVAGSTHMGEEKILLDIYKGIKGSFKKLILIIVPRHPERAGEIENLIHEYGFRYTLRSKLKSDLKLSDFDVVLVDTMGELFQIYNLANVVFIGKSLVKGGGQNLLEPAVLGKPVICGPLMHNFHDMTLWLKEKGGIIQIKDVPEFEKAIVDLLSNQEKCERIGSLARELIKNAAGTTEKSIKLTQSVILSEAEG